jgi:hypothetical protein
METPSTKEELRARLLEAAMALLQGAPNQELKVVLLNKGLFYLDLICLRDTGATATGATYLALDQGPVVAKYDRHLVAALENAGWAEQIVDGKAKPLRVKTPLQNFPHLSSSILKLATEMGRDVARLNSTQASEFSHRNPGWKVAYETGLGGHGSPKAINMRLALQQLADGDDDDRDPWLAEPADAGLLKAFRDASIDLNS